MQYQFDAKNEKEEVNLPSSSQVMENHNRTLRVLLMLTWNATPSCIVFPPNAGAFHFKNGMIQLLPAYHGLKSEQPYLHIKEFEEVCATFNDQACTKELIRLKLFPFSVKDKAKA